MKIKGLVLMLSGMILTVSTAVFAKNTVTMYAPDGRTVDIDVSCIEEYQNVGWFTQMPVTLYNINGETKYVLPEQAEMLREQGWYENKDDVTVIMYAPDGRTRSVFKGQVEAYSKVGWYENMEDAMVTMYSSDGTQKKFFKAYVKDKLNEGWFENKSDVFVTMYAVDGRSKDVLKTNVEAEKKVGWYTHPVVYMYAADGRRIIIAKSAVNDYKKVGWYDNEEDTYTYVYSLTDKKYVLKGKVKDWVAVGWSAKCYPVMLDVSFERNSASNSCLDLNISVQNTNSRCKSISSLSFDACFYDASGNPIKDVYGKNYTRLKYDCRSLSWYSQGNVKTRFFANVTGCYKLLINNIEVTYTDGTTEKADGFMYAFSK